MQMAKQQKRTYTDEQKAEALHLYAKVGPSEAGRRLKIPGVTIASWAERAGVQMEAAERLKPAIEMAKLTREQKRENLRDAMLDEALTVVGDISKPQTIEIDGRELSVPAPKPAERKDLSITLKNLIETSA